MWAWVENVIPWSSKVTLIRPLCLGMSLCGYKRKKNRARKTEEIQKDEDKERKEGGGGARGREGRIEGKREGEVSASSPETSLMVNV